MFTLLTNFPLQNCALWLMHSCEVWLFEILPPSIFLHNIILLKRKRCSTSPKSAIMMFLSVTSKAAFVCFKCHLRTLYLYSLTFGVVSISLTFNPTLWIFGPRASQYLFYIYCEVWVLKLKLYISCDWSQWTGSWSKTVLTVIIFTVMHGSLSNFFHSHATTLTSYTGLRVNQISLSSLNTDGCQRKSNYLRNKPSVH